MIETKRCYVKSGAERWDYDLNPPQCEVIDYWVMLGEQKIFNSGAVDLEKLWQFIMCKI